MSKYSGMNRSVIALLAAGLLAGGLATAALAEGSSDHLGSAWQDAFGDQEPILTQQQFAAFNNLAYAAAITRVCDGYEIDVDKFSKAFADAMQPSGDAMSSSELDQWTTAVLFRFGASYGLFIAEGNASPDRFCASADELKAKAEAPNVWQ